MLIAPWAGKASLVHEPLGVETRAVACIRDPLPASQLAAAKSKAGKNSTAARKNESSTAGPKGSSAMRTRVNVLARRVRRWMVLSIRP
jgi:hypothetical protein